MLSVAKLFWLVVVLVVVNLVGFWYLAQSKSTKFSLQAVSDIPGYGLKIKESEFFNGFIKEWEVGKKGMIVRSSSRPAELERFHPKYVVVHLTDQLQDWDHIVDSIDPLTQNVLYAAGEKMDEKTKTLDVFIFVNTGLELTGSVEDWGKLVSRMALRTLYMLSHPEVERFPVELDSEINKQIRLHPNAINVWKK